MKAQKVLVTGATGFVGQALLENLKNEGYEIAVLTRNGNNTSVRVPVYCEVHQCDLNREVPSPDVFEGVDAVIHLAGENIGDGRWSRTRKKRIQHSRVQGTANLIEGLAGLDQKPAVLVSASAVGFYGDQSGNVLDELSPQGNGFLANVCGDWEKAALQAQSVGIRTAVYRFGVVLGYDGGALKQMWAPFQLGFGGRLGSGNQWMSWIHVKDLASSLIHAVCQEEVQGIYNAVSPHPATNSEFTKALGNAMDQTAPFPVPAPVLRIVMGEMADILLHSQRVSSNKLCSSGFSFQYPDLDSALAEICSHSGHELRFEQWVPSDRQKTFSFFKHPENVEAVTPPALGLKVERIKDEGLNQGSQITMSFSLSGIPIQWVSKVGEWDPDHGFSDSQIRGPFSTWTHSHEFQDKEGGTLIRDRINYRLPLGVLGDWIAGSWVRKRLEDILGYRTNNMARILHS